MSEQKNKLTRSSVEELYSLLKKAHKKLVSRSRFISLFSALTVLFIGITILIYTDQTAYFSAEVKSSVALIILILSTSIGVLFYRSSKTVDFNEFYQTLLKSINKKDLISAVDLYQDPSQNSSKFSQAAINRKLKGVSIESISRDVQSYIKSTKVNHYFNSVSVILVLSASIFAFTSVFITDSTSRTLTLWETFDKPNPYLFSVLPGDTTIVHGSSIEAGVIFESDNIPNNLLFAFKTDVEEEFRSRPLREVSPNLFQIDPIELTNNVTFYIEMDGFKSEQFKIDVELQPRFDQLTVTVSPPPYTGLADREHSYPYSEINFYEGSTITLSGRTNKPISSAILQTKESIFDLEITQDSSDLAFTFKPEGSDTLHFDLKDNEGISNRNRFRTVLKQLADQYPVVSIQEPTGTILKTDPREIEVFYQATDDFGLTRADLKWTLRRAFVETPIEDAINLSRPANGRIESFEWDLSDMNLRPRDELEFKVRVWDNDAINGYKMGESQKVIIQVPSLADYFEELDSSERDIRDNLDEVTERFQSMEQEYQDFLERLRQNPDGGFEEQQIMEEIKERQEQIEETVRQMNERFEQLQNEIQQSDRTSEDTRRAYRELQQLMNELDDPALREAMEQMQQALENMSPQELERALENMDFNEQLYRERLERTVELFKRLKMNSDLDKIATQYEDLSQRTAPNPDQNQDQLQNELNSVQEDIDTLENQLQDLDSNPPKRSEETLRKLKEDALSNLEQIKDQLEQLMQGSESTDDPPTGEDIQNQQQQISENLQEEAEKFRSSIQQMSGQQLQVNILALQRSLYTLLELSSRQEYLSQSSSETRNRSQGFVDLARSQRNVSNQFSFVADTLFQIASEIPGVPNAVIQKKTETERTINRSVDEMVERNQRGATVTSRESLAGINDLTSMVASLVDQLMDQQNGGGEGGGGMSMQQMVEQMQQMSGDQMQLNQQLQDLVNDLQGERLTREESERLDQLARQQNEIRNQMRELQRRGALNPGDRAMSELERMIEQMEESINDMRGGMTDPLMVQRQQNILSRMLETEESLQQRGESDEREGRDITSFDRTLPPEMTLEELQQEIRSRLQDPNFSRFSERYQRLIELYFEQLRRFEDRPVPN